MQCPHCHSRRVSAFALTWWHLAVRTFSRRRRLDCRACHQTFWQ